MQIQPRRYTAIPMAALKSLTIPPAGEDWGKQNFRCWWDCIIMSSQSLTELNLHVPCDPAIPSCPFPQEKGNICPQEDLNMNASNNFVTVTPSWKQSKRHQEVTDKPFVAYLYSEILLSCEKGKKPIDMYNLGESQKQ